MKKIYLEPSTMVVKTNCQDSLLGTNSINSTEAGTGSSGSPVNFGKEGMTPVSEDNANALWED